MRPSLHTCVFESVCDILSVSSLAVMALQILFSVPIKVQETPFDIGVKQVYMCCSELQGQPCSAMQGVAVGYSVLQCVAVCCSALQFQLMQTRISCASMRMLIHACTIAFTHFMFFNRTLAHMLVRSPSFRNLPSLTLFPLHSLSLLFSLSLLLLLSLFR